MGQLAIVWANLTPFAREGQGVGPEVGPALMHSCGNTATKGWGVGLTSGPTRRLSYLGELGDVRAVVLAWPPLGRGTIQTPLRIYISYGESLDDSTAVFTAPRARPAYSLYYINRESLRTITGWCVNGFSAGGVFLPTQTIFLPSATKAPAPPAAGAARAAPAAAYRGAAPT
jgi:hypothetical protein